MMNVGNCDFIYVAFQEIFYCNANTRNDSISLKN